MNLPLSNKIINLKTVNECINFSSDSKKIVCIGVDGPTASGKTIFAELLREKITNSSKKDVQIIPLDSLLIDRSSREKCLHNLHKSGIPFEHEAEIHMRFSKLDYLLNIIKLKKVDGIEESNIVLNDLYSREDNGKCTGRLEINLSNNTVLIFEGHYTTRPEFSDVLDRNFILLADRYELIKRKIARVSNYRNKEEVEEYFNLIDEPSYLSNYFRFASKNALIIDNSNFSNPLLAKQDHIFRLLNTKKFLAINTFPIKKIKEFLFGLHGLSTYTPNEKNNFESIFNVFNEVNILFSRECVSDIFSRYKIPHMIIYFDYLRKYEFEVGLITELFGKNCTWIINKNNQQTNHLISWEGGIYKIENGMIERLPLTSKEIINKNKSENFWDNLIKSNGLISSTLLKNNIKNNMVTHYSFLENTRKISFFAATFEYTQIKCKSLGDLLMLSYNWSTQEKFEKFTSKPNPLKISSLSIKKIKTFNKKTDSFFLTNDFLILKEKLNEVMINELKETYFSSNDLQLRSTILNGLMKKENEIFIPEIIRNFLLFSICFFPTSMSRLYILRRLGLEDSNVLATNIYDITDNPIDTSAYLEAAYEKSLPVILQISLNASGQSEIKQDCSINVGYLEPKNGINDFTDSVIETIVKILEESNFKNHLPPLIGIGLDHIDLRGDIPSGRSNRFLKSAILTESITHITLDGSGSFKPKSKVKSELFKAYEEVFKTSLRFLDKIKFEGIDLEFCTGELNYIGNETNPHYPDGEEMELLPISFNKSLEEEKNTEYKSNLLNSIKLYVGNLGTCHHGSDKKNSLRIELGKEWQESLLGSNFISPVLHGTTGSSDNTFLLASKSCQKINIAGSLLRVLLENLSPSQKKKIGFENFDETSKFLCKKLGKIKNENFLFNKKELKKEFIKYCSVNNVNSISSRNLKIIRKPFYGRNKIAKYIFSEIQKMISL